MVQLCKHQLRMFLLSLLSERICEVLALFLFKSHKNININIKLWSGQDDIHSISSCFSLLSTTISPVSNAKGNTRRILKHGKRKADWLEIPEQEDWQVL